MKSLCCSVGVSKRGTRKTPTRKIPTRMIPPGQFPPGKCFYLFILFSFNKLNIKHTNKTQNSK